MWERIKAVTSSAWEYIRPVVILFASTAGKQLAAIAIAAVRNAAAQDGLSNREKRDYAFDQIRNDMPKLGESAINLAIEIAVQKLKQ